VLLEGCVLKFGTVLELHAGVDPLLIISCPTVICASRFERGGFSLEGGLAVTPGSSWRRQPSTPRRHEKYKAKATKPGRVDASATMAA